MINKIVNLTMRLAVIWVCLLATYIYWKHL